MNISKQVNFILYVSAVYKIPISGSEASDPSLLNNHYKYP